MSRLTLWLLALSLAFHCCAGQEDPDSDAREADWSAYVTFVAGEGGFVLGARVLGHSILEQTATQRDMLCLVTGQLSHTSSAALRAAGWRLQTVPSVDNPGTGASYGRRGYPSKLAAVYSKLAVFGLGTQYRRLVYLDADTLCVSPALEQLFGCPAELCASLRHSEQFNSGMLALEPHASVMSNMTQLMGTLRSSTGGDQGFLNSYYAGFASSPLFQPGDVPMPRTSPLPAAPGSTARLSTAFNADVGLYVLNGCGALKIKLTAARSLTDQRTLELTSSASLRCVAASNKWPLPRDTLSVLHYTLGPLKPWQWWTPWLIDAADEWQAVRRRTGAGVLGWSTSHATQLLAASLLLAAAPAMAYGPALRRHRLLHQSRALALRRTFSARCAAWLATRRLGAPEGTLRVLTIAAVQCCGVMAPLLSLLIVPRTATPALGWILFYSWTFALFSVTFGWWLSLAHVWGLIHGAAAAALLTAAGGPPSPRLAVVAQQWTQQSPQSPSAVLLATRRAAMAAAAALLAAPCLPGLLGLRGILAPVGLVAGCAFVQAIVAAAATPILAQMYFEAGVLKACTSAAPTEGVLKCALV